MDTVAIDRHLTQHDLYQGDNPPCDVVMKGGITSGVTYPKAVCEIASAYELRNIGGTSAGALAAAAAAAAEVGRDIQGAGFARLATLPGRLSAIPKSQSKSVLFNLFRPSGPTRPLFRILAAFQKGKVPRRPVNHQGCPTCFPCGRCLRSDHFRSSGRP